MKAKVIHIAGSKGKGTTASLLARILELCGAKVGVFTSPFLFDESEMICVNGVAISGSDLERLREGLEGSDFEQITAAAFEYFETKKCDYVVLECGWGGKIDATNTVDSKVLTILTHIELEHTEVLGSSVEEITREKLGICRPGVPLLTVSTQLPEVYRTISDEGLSAVIVPSVDLGNHHPDSVGLALAAAEQLGIVVTPEMFADLESFVIPGRFEIVKYGKHTLILDGAHTYDSIIYLRDKVLDFATHHDLSDPFWAIHFLSDKREDLPSLFPRTHTIWIEIDDERAGTPPEYLNSVTVEQLLRSLEKESEAQFVVFVGSFKLVAGVKGAL